MILFDEAAGQRPEFVLRRDRRPRQSEPGIDGPGGGRTGRSCSHPASPPARSPMTPYNHYSMLASVEDLFGLTHLGYAAGPGATPFGSDIYNRSCGAAAPTASIPPRHCSLPSVSSSPLG